MYTHAYDIALTSLKYDIISSKYLGTLTQVYATALALPSTASSLPIVSWPSETAADHDVYDW